MSASTRERHLNGRSRPLEGRVALVTGSTRGIGYQIATQLVADGAKVIVNGRDAIAVERASRRIAGDNASVVGIAADVGDADAVAGLLEQAIATFGLPDILVNNAALSGAAAESHFLDTDEPMWDRVLTSNLKSVYLCSRAIAWAWAERSIPGVIVNVSSFASQRAHRMAAAYDASKGGVDALTRAMALDLAPLSIRVNAVAPGPIDVDEHQRHPDDVRAARAALVPLGRTGTPADVAPVVAFLASDAAAYITGQVIIVDGGMSAQLRPPAADEPLPASVLGLLSLSTHSPPSHRAGRSARGTPARPTSGEPTASAGTPEPRRPS